MKLTIFGATGATGRLLVDQALARGDEVTAVVRDASRLPVRHAALRVVEADVFDPTSLQPLLAGADAALSALGARRGSGDTSVCGQAVPAILEAMAGAGVARLVTISAVPVVRHDPGDGAAMRVAKPLLHRAFGSLYADLASMEDALRASAAEWTVFRAPLLTNGRRTGRYRTTLGRNAYGGFKVSRADLADAMLRALGDPATVRTVVGIAG